MKEINLREVVTNILENQRLVYGINHYDLPYKKVIQYVRTKKRIKQQDMADFLGISQNMYSKLETGYSSLGRERLEKIAAFLEIDLEIVDEVAKKFASEKQYNSKSEEDRSSYIDDIMEEGQKIIDEYKLKVNYLETTVKAQSETIQLLKEKIAMLENKK